MILNNNTQDFTMSARAEVQSIYLFIYYFATHNELQAE